MATDFTYLTLEQVSEITHAADRTIRRYVASGELPATRVGKRLLVDGADLAAFMRRRQVRPRPRAVPA